MPTVKVETKMVVTNDSSQIWSFCQQRSSWKVFRKVVKNKETIDFSSYSLYNNCVKKSVFDTIKKALKRRKQYFVVKRDKSVGVRLDKNCLGRL